MIGRTLFETLKVLYPDEKWSYRDTTEELDFKNLKFENDDFTPDETKIKETFDVKKVELENHDKANAYVLDRVVLYPDIGDQLDDLYKQGVFSSDMTAKIKKVKDDNPKPKG